MTRRVQLVGWLLALCLIVAHPASAVQPDEVLPDPVLEARARNLSQELRCLVCQNQSIDDSSSELARDLRLLVRERLSAGDDDEAVIRYLVARYGEFVLLKPAFNARNAMLWGTPVLVLAVGALFLWRRRPGVGAGAKPLDHAETEALERILRHDA